MDSRNSGTKPWASSVCRVLLRPGFQVFSGSGCQVLTGFQRQQKGAFSCVPVAYRALRTAPENHGFRGNTLETCGWKLKFSEAPKVLSTALSTSRLQTPVSLVTPSSKSAVLLLHRLLQRPGKCGISCLPICLPPRCLPWAKNARFHGYRLGYLATFWLPCLPQLTPTDPIQG